MVDYDFSARVAFVTGAARGQGQSHALRYARHGATVVATDVVVDTDDPSSTAAPEASLRGTVDAIRDAGGTAIGVELDVADEAAVKRAVGRALDEFGRIDFLANYASVAPRLRTARTHRGGVERND